MSGDDRATSITRLLEEAADEPRRTEELLPLVYDELRALARARLAQEQPGQTIQATALVHEAWMRVAGSDSQDTVVWNGRGHFFGAAALAMRRILVERARAKGRDKRGGGRLRVDLEHVELGAEPESGGDLVRLDDLVRALETRDPRKGQIVNLRCFAGLTAEQTADVLGVSLGTVEREWRFVKAWLLEGLRHEA